MKKILIAVKDLKIGGIEKASVALAKFLFESGYDVTFVLEEKRGELLENLGKNINIIEYKPSTVKFIPLRKFINFAKQLKFSAKYTNKYDCSISFATYSKTSSFIARKASNNSILWCHADYLALFAGDKEKTEDFFFQLYYDKFSKIVFVAESAKNSFMKIFPKQENVYICNNFIDSNEIFTQAKKDIGLKYSPEIVTFLNVSRHDEKQKKLTRIFQATKKLKEEGYKFRVIFVGEGKDTKKYKKVVQKLGIQENVIFMGAKKNPYPYFKISNCVVLSSDYEGYPVVFLESYILNKPIITTDVSDYEDVQNGHGIVVKKNYKEIYKAMKSFIENGYEIKKNFDAIKYNSNIAKKLTKIINS